MIGHKRQVKEKFGKILYLAITLMSCIIINCVTNFYYSCERHLCLLIRFYALGFDKFIVIKNEEIFDRTI